MLEVEALEKVHLVTVGVLRNNPGRIMTCQPAKHILGYVLPGHTSSPNIT